MLGVMAKLRKLACASDPDGLRRAVSDIVRRQGVEHWAYALNLPLVNERVEQFVIAEYPGVWVERYYEAGYLQVDPIVAHCHDCSTPLLWTESKAALRAAIDPHHMRVRRMFDEAEEVGLGSGVSVPLHGPGRCWGLMSFAAPFHRRRELESKVALLSLVAHFTHEAARPFARVREAIATVALTARERECLHWAAEGKTSWEVGCLLGVSERTAIFHLHNAARKLGVSGRQAAVARAVALGVVSVA